MQQTSNYQLNQWEGTDRILRTDFNADNAKIDAAIAAVRNLCPVEKLLETSITSTSTQADIDVSSIDLTAYRTLMIYLNCSSNTTAARIQLRLNDLESYQDHSLEETWLAQASIGEVPQKGDFRFFVTLGNYCTGEGRSVYYYNSSFRCNSSNIMVADLAASAIKKLRLIGDSGDLGSGSRVILMGLKW